MRSTRRTDRFLRLSFIILLSTFTCSASAQAPKLDERPAEPGTWGYRPDEGDISQTDPPSFSWRPQRGLTWEIECARDAAFADAVYRAADIEFNVHCPPRTFGKGSYTWRYRGRDKAGRHTAWSKPRTFTIAADAMSVPMPERKELLARIPKTHPRLFLRPENLGRLRELAHGEMKSEYERLVNECERILARPPATKEPPEYPAGMERKSEEWREMWWGNRTYTIRALNGAARSASP